MKLDIIGLNVPLLFSPAFIQEVETVIDKNVDTNVQLVALFISRLLKGLQNLANSDEEVLRSWGQFSYEIEDVGIVLVSPLYDPDTLERSYAVESIKWTFATGKFFMELL